MTIRSHRRPAFCRKLARSRQRLSRKHVDAMLQLGRRAKYQLMFPELEAQEGITSSRNLGRRRGLEFTANHAGGDMYPKRHGRGAPVRLEGEAITEGHGELSTHGGGKQETACPDPSPKSTRSRPGFASAPCMTPRKPVPSRLLNVPDMASHPREHRANHARAGAPILHRNPDQLTLPLWNHHPRPFLLEAMRRRATIALDPCDGRTTRF